MSLHCKLLQVQYREHEDDLLQSPQPTLNHGKHIIFFNNEKKNDRTDFQFRVVESPIKLTQG